MAYYEICSNNFNKYDIFFSPTTDAQKTTTSDFNSVSTQPLSDNFLR